jgi:predicted small metal-binding protein
MLQYCCECGAVFTGDSDREIMLEAVDHACQEHDSTDTPAQAAVLVLDGIVEAA